MASPSAQLPRNKSLQFPAYPIYTQLNLFLRIWVIKFVSFTALRLKRLFRGESLRQSSPNYTKRYPVHWSLENRVFLPPNAAQSRDKYPLLFSIHGGGFAICDPQIDDHINRRFADDHGFVVVALNYRKAPRNPYPTSINDVADLIQAVLADKDIPVDHSCVGIMGFSAGGVLSLSVPQLPEIRDKVHFLVPVYAATDFSKTYRGDYFPMRDGRDDILKSLIPAFDWAYIPPGTDTTDPLLSPVYATNEQLPHRVYFVSAEYDVLCEESRMSAKLLADAGDELAAQGKWEKGRIKFRIIANATHGFTHPDDMRPDDTLSEKELAEIYQDIAEWAKKK